MLRAPELEAGLDVGFHQGGVEGQNHLPRPAGDTSLDAAQDTVGLLGSERTWVAHVKLFFPQYPQVLLLRAAPLIISTGVLCPVLGSPVQER